MTQLHPLNEDPQDPWTLLYSTDKGYRVEILKALLEEEEIPSVILNKQDSSYLVFGEVQLLVRRSDLLKSEQVLHNFLKNE